MYHRKRVENRDTVFVGGGEDLVGVISRNWERKDVGLTTCWVCHLPLKLIQVCGLPLFFLLPSDFLGAFELNWCRGLFWVCIIGIMLGMMSPGDEDIFQESCSSSPHTSFAKAPISSFGVPIFVPSGNSEECNDCTTEWLETMKASSPSRIGKIHDHCHSGDVEDIEYRDWISQHPSALETFEEMMSTVKDRKIAVFLDYDGTLSPIVDDPERAFMSEEMRATVKKVSTYFPTAIISGRRRDKVYQFVQLPELYYAGSHGMDIMGPAQYSNGTRGVDDVVSFQPASEFLPIMDEVYNELQTRSKDVKGAKVEHNKFCVTVHFRCVEEERWSFLAEIVHFVLLKYPELSLIKGRKVLEIRPSIEWDKGKALEYLLEALGLDGKEVLPIYIGDDRTDEDAFNVLRARGIGYPILVAPIAKTTSASYSLKDPLEVMQFLTNLVQWKVSKKHAD